MKKILLTCCLAFFFLEVYTQNHQTERKFDRDWLFARYGIQADGSYIQEPKNLEKMFTDDSKWRNLDLPHDWAIEGPFQKNLEGSTGKLPWRGIGWYRKHFTVSNRDRNKRFYLDFDGAMANAEVWLNGVKIGARPYGYSSFRVDLTPNLQYGKNNLVAVRLNTEKWGSRWYPGAGIYRHVHLVQVNQVHIAHWGVFVTTPKVTDESATVSVQIEVENHELVGVNCKYKVCLYHLDVDDRLGSKVVESCKEELKIPAQSKSKGGVLLKVKAPQKWDLHSPNRYLARVTVFKDKKKIDTYDVPFGIRTIAFTHDHGFLLNGNRVPINGVCMHHDLGALGTAINSAALRRQIQILKSFGCNAIRTSHNMPAPDLLHLADKLGIMIMDEAFDCWRFSKNKNDYASLFDKWHERDLGDLIRRDRNHPSVILWSTGNEVAEQYRPELGTAKHLTEIVHRYDITRPVSFGASYPSRSAFNGTELQVDVHGMNYPSGVYGGPHLYRDFQNKEGHEHLSGFASESSSTMSSRGEYFPRKFHVSSYDLTEPGWGSLPDQEFTALDRYPGICGEFVWTGFDYIGEPTPFNSDKSVLLNHVEGMSKEEFEKQKKVLEQINNNRPTSRSSYFGIVDIAGFPKDRYYLYKSRWMPNEPLTHILPHWTFPNRKGEIIPVFVYTSGDEVELFLNGRFLGRKQKGQYEYRLRWDSIVYEPGILKAVAYKNGQYWSEDKVQTTGEAVSLKVTTDKTLLYSDGDDLAFIRVAFVDSNGNEIPTIEKDITCNLLGEGKIIATDNGDPTCLIPFNCKTRPAFNGLFLAIIKANEGTKGKLVLRVTSEGLPSVELVLRVKNKIDDIPFT